MKDQEPYQRTCLVNKRKILQLAACVIHEIPNNSPWLRTIISVMVWVMLTTIDMIGVIRETVSTRKNDALSNQEYQSVYIIWIVRHKAITHTMDPSTGRANQADAIV
jgi:hypothetical protein